MANKRPEAEFDTAGTITRLLAEVRQLRKMIDEIQQAFRNSPQLDGLSLTGAAYAVLKRNNELEAEVERLDREIRRMIKDGK